MQKPWAQKVFLPQPGNSLQRFAVFGLTQVLQIRLPSLPETKMRPSSQNGTQLLSELHFWSTAHCCAPLHSTQTQLLLLQTPVDPHWASVTQSRQWWSTHERPDGQAALRVHATVSQRPPTQPPRAQSLSALHDGLWHDPLMHRGKRLVHSESALHLTCRQRPNTHASSTPAIGVGGACRLRLGGGEGDRHGGDRSEQTLDEAWEKIA